MTTLQRAGSAILVGERTPGAVIPATFRDVGDGMVLMYPAFTMGRHTRAIEGVGVTPDLEAPYRLAHAAGRDDILRAGLLAASAWAAEREARPRSRGRSTPRTSSPSRY